MPADNYQGWKYKFSYNALNQVTKVANNGHSEGSYSYEYNAKGKIIKTSFYKSEYIYEWDGDNVSYCKLNITHDPGTIFRNGFSTMLTSYDNKENPFYMIGPFMEYIIFNAPVSKNNFLQQKNIGALLALGKAIEVYPEYTFSSAHINSMKFDFYDYDTWFYIWGSPLVGFNRKGKFNFYYNK